MNKKKKENVILKVGGGGGGVWGGGVGGGGGGGEGPEISCSQKKGRGCVSKIKGGCRTLVYQNQVIQGKKEAHEAEG